MIAMEESSIATTVAEAVLPSIRDISPKKSPVRCIAKMISFPSSLTRMTFTAPARITYMKRFASSCIRTVSFLTNFFTRILSRDWKSSSSSRDDKRLKFLRSSKSPAPARFAPEPDSFCRFSVPVPADLRYPATGMPQASAFSLILSSSSRLTRIDIRLSRPLSPFTSLPCLFADISIGNLHPFCPEQNTT